MIFFGTEITTKNETGKGEFQTTEEIGTKGGKFKYHRNKRLPSYILKHAIHR